MSVVCEKNNGEAFHGLVIVHVSVFSPGILHHTRVCYVFLGKAYCTVYLFDVTDSIAHHRHVYVCHVSLASQTIIKRGKV